MIIVSSNIKIANKYTEYIKNKYPTVRAGIATSEDSKSGSDVIRRSKIDNSIKNLNRLFGFCEYRHMKGLISLNVTL